MIVLDDVVHHTGSNTKKKLEIPLSRFKVTAHTNSKEPWGEPAEFDAVDESDAISQYVKLKNIRVATGEKGRGSSGLRFEAEVIKEQRADKLAPPEPKAKMLKSPKREKKDK